MTDKSTKKQEKKELRNWQKFIERMKAKDALVEEAKKEIKQFFTFENHASNLDWRFYK